jgi:tryptophan-rich sensory protein
VSSRGFRNAVLAIASVTAASLLGQIATYPNLPSWYAGLNKPSFNPPNWVFAPVWTTLFVLMGFAFWRILQLDESVARQRAILVFAVMLAFNALWSWMFFAAHSPALGLINIVPQWLLIGAAIASFGRLDRLAAACLVPLFAWVGFAAVLNFSILQLNG